MKRRHSYPLSTLPLAPWGGTLALAVVHSLSTVFLLNAGFALAAKPSDEHIGAQWGVTPARNNVAPAQSLPEQWEVGEFDFRTGRWTGGDVQNLKWVAKLGSESYGSPVIAGGKIFCATNNGAGYLDRYPPTTDLGCLLAFDQNDGKFLWQYSAEKLKAGRAIDWPRQGICAAPLLEGDRLWVVTNRGEVVCLDTEGFLDGENDPPVRDEAAEGGNEADVVWRFNMMRELGVVQHNMASCSVTAAGNLLFVLTSNGVDGTHETIPAPEAPSFIALDKTTGKLLWADNSPGTNILHGQWGSPAMAELDGVPQVIFPGGDGWVYAFLAKPSTSGKPELLWKFDCNPKDAVWDFGQGRRNNIIATPVIHEGRVYIATGQDPEAGEGPGDLWCIDPSKRGDTSAELVVDARGDPVPPRRVRAVDFDAGERVVPNPNSGCIWRYQGHDSDGDGELGFEETMHRSIGMVAIADGLLVTGDFAGLVHCLEAKTGRQLWTHDVLTEIWGSPLIADGKIYLGTVDGDVLVFELSQNKNLLATNYMGDSVYTTPAAIDGVLYVATRSNLFAITSKEGSGAEKAK